MCPCEDLTRWGVFIFFGGGPKFSSVKIFRKINVDHLSPIVFGKKKKEKKRRVRPRDGHEEHLLCAKLHDLSLKNGVNMYLNIYLCLKMSKVRYYFLPGFL